MLVGKIHRLVPFRRRIPRHRNRQRPLIASRLDRGEVNRQPFFRALQHEQSAEKGLTIYFTPIKAGSNERTLPIAVAWNPATKRYQSMDLSYQHFLGESPSLENPRSMLR